MTESGPATWLESTIGRIEDAPRFILGGQVTRVIGQVIESSTLPIAIGELCRIGRGKADCVLAQVVGFHDSGTMLMPLGETDGVRPGAEVLPLGRPFHAQVGNELIGRVLNGLGSPLDSAGPVRASGKAPLVSPPPSPLERTPIMQPLGTGVRSIDGLLTLGRGQRVGILSGSGVGKSMLLGMIARHTAADVNVIALLGERGREVRDFIERDLGSEALRRSVVVVATSDQTAVARSNAALLATAIAEHFRSAGRDVLLMMDSVTRVAMAWREIGLSVGEPPTTKGYPPSVFSALSRLLERAGTSRTGSITGLYTVLVEGDDFNEPIADATRATLDGHIVLSRDLANSKHFPAVDVLASVSRVRSSVVSARHLEAADRILQLEASYRAHEDLISVGAYKAGTDLMADAAIRMRPRIQSFLCQEAEEHVEFGSIVSRLADLAQQTGAGSQGVGA